MDSQLITTLQNYGLSEKEAKVYLTALELGSSPASTIARRSEIKRVTVYTILNDLKKDGIVNENAKEDVKYYSVITPDNLLRQLEQKYESFKEKVPELMALADKFGNRPQIQFFEGLEGMKYVYRQIILSEDEMEAGEPFLTFLGTTEIDPKFHKYLSDEFVPWRLKHKTKTKAIISKQSLTQEYSKRNKEEHDSVIIDDPLFDMANEVVIHGKDKVSILMYAPNEMSALVITSQTLHNALKSIFNLVWKSYKK